MGIKTIVVALLICASLASSPVVLVSEEQHEPLFTSADLLNFLGQEIKTKVVELTSTVGEDLSELKTVLEQSGISKERISSFLTSSEKMVELKEQLKQLPALTHLTVSIKQLKKLLKEKKAQNIIITMQAPQATPRRLQTPNVTNTTVESRIFNDITPYSLSGLWVALFLLIVLLIGINCLLGLKTNDRFARQNLWVGRES